MVVIPTSHSCINVSLAIGQNVKLHKIAEPLVRIHTPEVEIKIGHARLVSKFPLKFSESG